MNEIIKIINKLKDTQSINEKISILKINKNIEKLRLILYYTYADNLMYGFSEKKIREALAITDKGGFNSSVTHQWNDVFSMLDELSSNNINDMLRNKVMLFLNNCKSLAEKELYIRILMKDLRCNISAKTINKAIPKLIPTWDIQQAYPREKHKLKKDEWIALSLKLNGIRGTKFKDKFKSRQNKEMLGLDHIMKDIESIPQLKGYVIDGEMVRKNTDGVSDNENFRLTTSILNSDGDKSEIEFIIFDLIPIDEFITGESKNGFKNRLEDLERLNDYILLLQLQNLRVATTFYTGIDHSRIEELLDKVDKEGKEGLMLLRDVPYKTKRHSGILKCKKFKTADCKIIGYEEGTGRLNGTLGSFVIDYKSNKVNVGSGYSDIQRKEYWANKDEYIGRVLQVKFKEESMDSKTKLISLQFPTFECIREIGKEVSYN